MARDSGPMELATKQVRACQSQRGRASEHARTQIRVVSDASAPGALLAVLDDIAQGTSATLAVTPTGRRLVVVAAVGRRDVWTTQLPEAIGGHRDLPVVLKPIPHEYRVTDAWCQAARARLEGADLILLVVPSDLPVRSDDLRRMRLQALGKPIRVVIAVSDPLGERARREHFLAHPHDWLTGTESYAGRVEYHRALVIAALQEAGLAADTPIIPVHLTAAFLARRTHKTEQRETLRSGSNIHALMAELGQMVMPLSGKEADRSHLQASHDLVSAIADETLGHHRKLEEVIQSLGKKQSAYRGHLGRLVNAKERVISYIRGYLYDSLPDPVHRHVARAGDLPYAELSEGLWEALQREEPFAAAAGKLAEMECGLRDEFYQWLKDDTSVWVTTRALLPKTRAVAPPANWPQQYLLPMLDWGPALLAWAALVSPLAPVAGALEKSIPPLKEAVTRRQQRIAVEKRLLRDARERVDRILSESLNTLFAQSSQIDRLAQSLFETSLEAIGSVMAETQGVLDQCDRSLVVIDDLLAALDGGETHD